jgi:hypothetical protein
VKGWNSGRDRVFKGGDEVNEGVKFELPPFAPTTAPVTPAAPPTAPVTPAAPPTAPFTPAAPLIAPVTPASMNSNFKEETWKTLGSNEKEGLKFLPQTNSATSSGLKWQNQCFIKNVKLEKVSLLLFDSRIYDAFCRKHSLFVLCLHSNPSTPTFAELSLKLIPHFLSLFSFHLDPTETN